MLFVQVNSFDSVRYVDALYRSKYFLTSIAGSNQNHVTPSVDMLGRNDSQKVSRPESYNVRGKNPENHISDGANSQNMIVGEVHKVTILNLPPEVDENTRKSKTSSIHQSSPKDKTMLTTVGNEDGGLNMPILPWINGDGTTNKIVYKGLRRRMFGIVMQNPGILEVWFFLLLIPYGTVCWLLDCVIGLRNTFLLICDCLYFGLDFLVIEVCWFFFFSFFFQL